MGTLINSADPETLWDADGCVYGVYCIPTDETYIGETANTLRARLQHHKSSTLPLAQCIAEYGTRSFVAVPITVEPDASKRAAIESRVIKDARRTLNRQCHRVFISRRRRGTEGVRPPQHLRHQGEDERHVDLTAPASWPGYAAALHLHHATTTAARALQICQLRGRAHLVHDAWTFFFKGQSPNAAEIIAMFDERFAALHAFPRTVLHIPIPWIGADDVLKDIFLDASLWPLDPHELRYVELRTQYSVPLRAAVVNANPPPPPTTSCPCAQLIDSFRAARMPMTTWQGHLAMPLLDLATGLGYDALVDVLKGGLKHRLPVPYEDGCKQVSDALDHWIATRAHLADFPLSPSHEARIQLWRDDVLARFRTHRPSQHINGAWRRELRSLQRFFVCVPIDKTAQDAAAVCNTHYRNTLLKTLESFTAISRDVVEESIEDLHALAVRLQVTADLTPNRGLPYLVCSPKFHKDGMSEAWRPIVGSSCDDKGRTSNYTSALGRYLNLLLTALIKDLAEINATSTAANEEYINRFFCSLETQDFGDKVRHHRQFLLGKSLLCTDLSQCYSNVPQDDMLAAVKWAFSLVSSYRRASMLFLAGDDIVPDDTPDSTDDLGLDPHRSRRYTGHDWSTTHGISEATLMEVAAMVIHHSIFETDGRTYRQTMGATIGGYASSPLVNLYLAWKEWTWVDSHDTDTTWHATVRNECNRFLHVNRYMDDRIADELSGERLPTAAHYGISY
jgi:hypothetical protein